MELVDQQADRAGRELHRIAQRYELPGYVKHAAWAETEELPRHLYADPGRRQFPIHTPAATWLSAAYFAEKRASFSERDATAIAQRLDQAADMWNILPDLVRIGVQRAALEKQAQASPPDSMFLFLRHDHKTGQLERHLRVANPVELQKAAVWLLRYRDQLAYPDRQQIADRLLRKAAELGVELEEDDSAELEKIAGLGVCRPADAIQMLLDRACIAQGQAREHLRKLASLATQYPKTLKRSRLQKLAAIIDVVDKTYRVHYGPTLPRPEDVLFSARFKQARAELDQQVRMLTGSVYEREQFAKLALDPIRDALGDEFAREVRAPLGGVDPEKMAVQAPVLPLGDQEILEDVFKAAGIQPVLKTAVDHSVNWRRWLPAAA